MKSSLKRESSVNRILGLFECNFGVNPMLICIKSIILVFSGLIGKFAHRKVKKIVSQLGVISNDVNLSQRDELGVSTEKAMKIHQMDIEENRNDFKKNISFFSNNCKMNFDLSEGWFLVTDIVDSTSKYYNNPIEMKRQIDLHDNIIAKNAYLYNGQIVNNEGDSWELVFENISHVVEFAANFYREISEQKLQFFVRMGLGKGKFLIREESGFKIYSGLIEYINDNMGCIKNNSIWVEKNKFEFAVKEGFLHLDCEQYKNFLNNLKSLNILGIDKSKL